MERERELRHFIHEHPLIFNERLKEYQRRFICIGCEKQMSDPNYSCKECHWFILHKSCAELPRELGHPLHRKHPLLLIHRYGYWKREIRCDGCNTEERLLGLIYHCSHCNFSLDIKCASLPLTIQAEIHQEHPLTLMRRSLCFTCDACGIEGKKGMFYLCAICPFFVHLECTSYPLVVKNMRHRRHPLHLTNSLQPQLNQSDHRLCLLCVQKVNTNYMVYYCSTCDFVTHLHCAANNEELLWDDTEPALDESIDSLPLPYVVKKSKLGEDNIEIAVEIKHFSHAHDLKLIDEQLNQNEEKCDGCVCPIYPPFYTCTQCTFFLHKSCVELPREKLHPLHRHPLILLTEAPCWSKSFRCDACDRICDGFTYRCDICNFDLDVQCSLISDIFKHEGHEHRLILSSKSNSDKYCSSCGSVRKYVFCCESCDACEFKLDFKCATLPRTIRYGPYEQPFRLFYEVEDIDSDEEYYCDICEKERNPNHWFYYCADLSFPAHPDCILGKKPYIKFGRT